MPVEEGEAYMAKINANAFVEVSSKTGENIKDLFDKVSKGLYKKYQTSAGFKQLVQPMGMGDLGGKSQSFNLKNNFSGGKMERNLKNKKNCCW